MCKYITAAHLAKPLSCRSKLTKPQVEEASQLAAMTAGLAGILKTEHGLSDEVVNKALIEPVETGDQNMCLELQGHLHAKQAKFNVMSIHSLAALVKHREEESNGLALASAGQSADTLKILQTGMEKKEWELLKNKLDFDEAMISVRYT